jgi:type I restriction enzyme R subunit
VNKKDLTEADIRTKFITPTIVAAGWDLMTQLSEEAYFTKGRVMVRGKTVARGEANKADYILFYKPNLPIAVIEAKDNNHTIASGMGQALEYAEILDVPFAFSSNGDGFLEHDRTSTRPPARSSASCRWTASRRPPSCGRATAPPRD